MLHSVLQNFLGTLKSADGSADIRQAERLNRIWRSAYFGPPTDGLFRPYKSPPEFARNHGGTFNDTKNRSTESKKLLA
jgi:hypothetical protein